MRVVKSTLWLIVPLSIPVFSNLWMVSWCMILPAILFYLVTGVVDLELIAAWS